MAELSIDTEAGTKAGPERLMAILATEPVGVAVGLLTPVDNLVLCASDEYGIIDETYVRPEYRGQNVARQLLDEAVPITTRRKSFCLDITGLEGDRNKRAPASPAHWSCRDWL